jgi:hypothetical protein
LKVLSLLASKRWYSRPTWAAVLVIRVVGLPGLLVGHGVFVLHQLHQGKILAFRGQWVELKAPKDDVDVLWVGKPSQSRFKLSLPDVAPGTDGIHPDLHQHYGSQSLSTTLLDRPKD